MRSVRRSGLQVAVILSSIVAFSSPESAARSLEPAIDLNYTYEQEHLGDNITATTTVQQTYGVTYETAVTPIFDMLAEITLSLEDTSGDREAETSSLAPSFSLAFNGPRASTKFSYDGSRDRTEQFLEAAESESFSSTYILEFEVTPDYWPRAKVKLERTRDFQEQQKEQVSRTFTLDLRKEIGDLSMEMNYEYDKTDSSLPSRTEATAISWSGKMAYQSTLWWDVDVDLTYEIDESLDEEFEKGVFTGESKDYTHAIQARLKKSLVLTPRLSADLEYEYEFDQDLLLLEEDYELTQNFALELDYELFQWLDVGAGLEREVEKIVNVPPEEIERSVQDRANVSFGLAPTKWLDLAGKASWTRGRSIDARSGGTLDTTSDATYELSARHRWGKWWKLQLTIGSEFGYENDWLVDKEAVFQADLDLIVTDNMSVKSGYEIERAEEYEYQAPLFASQRKREEIDFRFKYSRDFTDMIQVNFEHELSVTWESELDEVLDLTETAELTEDTKISLTLEDFIKDVSLEGEITRKATDTKDDEEPVLIDITYALKLDYSLRDLELGATFEYDDNGDTFDELTFNTKVGWGTEKIDVSGEYQFDKTYSDEIDEGRQLNLNLAVAF